MSTFDMTISPDDAYVVTPDEIEGVLQRLWRESVGEEIEATVVQVRTLNLLVLVPPTFATPEVMQAIDRITIRHPGRTITMLVKHEQHSPSAHVTIACRIGGEGKQACGEQITITCGDNGAPLPSIAASLIVADVPAFLWWLGDIPFHGSLLESLLETSDRIMVDSRTWTSPLAQMHSLAQAINEHPYIAFTDLQWTALTPWRRQTAQCFDMPDAQAYLNQLEQVVIEHGSREGDRLAALFFIGWLGTRLGWSVVDQQQPGEILVQAPHGPVILSLSQVDQANALVAVRLKGQGASFALDLQASIGCVKTTITLPSGRQIERIARLNTLDLEQVVSEDLTMLDRDSGFENALRFAARLIPGVDQAI
jgi:glucose-6-phosphate dehydrogenase assembly protein OpcA